MKAERYQEAYALIKNSQNILLATHENPDGDGISSMLAISLWARDQNIKTTLYSKDPIPQNLLFLPGVNDIQSRIPEGHFDLLVGFDYANFRRLGLDDWMRTQPFLKIVTFDHHPQGRQFGNIVILDTAASSTAEVLYNFFAVNNLPVGGRIATCLLAGIIVDTGGFKHSNVTPNTYRAASQLTLAGISIGAVTEQVFAGQQFKALRAWGEVLMRTSVDQRSGAAYSFLTQADLAKYGLAQEHFVEFSSIINTIPNTRFAAFLSEDIGEPGYIKGSLRSETYKGVDVSKIAKQFSGGGHVLASGFRTQGTLEGVAAGLMRAARSV
ncbi:MAG: bifunctional oligoribonuclease/PAP phosphatase NrnA [bacterium]|nr:bifunctional oligoribonuclease/PAP phosphatase NrnA [bacterium]